MNAPLFETSPRLGWQIRGALAVLGIVLATLLGTAARLRPDPGGLGTHQQLGLPPCTFKLLWNIRCPSCGMTTSWAWTMRGRLFRAFESNSGGALLALASLVAAPWSLATAIRGRWLLGRPDEVVLLCVFAGIFLVTLVDWAIRLSTAP